jgi:hypothetical protein
MGNGKTTCFTQDCYRIPMRLCQLCKTKVFTASSEDATVPFRGVTAARTGQVFRAKLGESREDL